MLNMNDPVVVSIVSARVGLLFNSPFFGNMITRMNLIQADGWCKTAATDGRNFYYNREFIKSLSPPELLFLLAHEVLHCVYDHLGRKGMRDHKIWNMANDYIVNYTLKHEGIGEMPKVGLYDAKYNDSMTSEEVYNELVKNSVKIEMTLDEHLDLNGGNGDKEGDGKKITVTVMGSSDGPPKLTEEDKQQIRNEIKAATINAAQAVSGKVPAGVKRLIEALTNPIMDWRTLLELHIQSQIKDDYTFQRPSKRSWSMGGKFVLPGQNFKKRIEATVFIDNSGSMTNKMILDLLTETKGIMDTFEDFSLLVACFDTQVYNPKVFTPENSDEILEYEPQGGGGTLFECMFDFMRDPASAGFGDDFPEPIEPAKLIVFTDGLPNQSWGDEEYADTLFLVHTNKHIEAPYGVTVPYEAD